MGVGDRVVKLTTETINAIRRAKSEGASLSEISRIYRCSKSTASSYCRDLFSYPTRKYQTEADARKRTPRLTPCLKCGKLIYAKKTGLCEDCYKASKNKYPPQNHGHQLIPCAKCEKTIRKNKSGLCVNCLYLERAKTAQPKQRIKAQNKKDRTIKYHKNLDRNYHPSKCPKSPSGYHHWLIDNMGIGTCIYCKTKKDMNYESTSFNSKGI